MIPQQPHTVATDPGIAWTKDEAVAIDAPPDHDTDPSPEARWPPAALRTGVCGAVSPNVVPLPGGGYRMYYTQMTPRPGHPAGANDYDNCTARILSAVSADGSSWTPEPGVRLSPGDGGAGEFRVVSPEVVPVPGGGGRLRMYFECCPGTQKEGSTIRSAVSENGEPEGFALGTAKPFPRNAQGAFGLHWQVEPGERLDSGSFNAPRLLHLDGGACRLYCSDRGGGIVSALCDDGGLTFRMEPGKRIEQELPYEAATAFAPEVLRIEGGGYRMYYAGYSDPTRAYVLTAASEDGLVWTKEPEPVIAPGGPLDRVKCSEMCVVQLPGATGEPPRYRMFYEACDGTAPGDRGVWRILSATSASP